MYGHRGNNFPYAYQVFIYVVINGLYYLTILQTVLLYCDNISPCSAAIANVTKKKKRFWKRSQGTTSLTRVKKCVIFERIQSLKKKNQKTEFGLWWCCKINTSKANRNLMQKYDFYGLPQQPHIVDLFIFNSSLLLSFLNESCPSHLWSKCNTPWNTEPWSMATFMHRNLHHFYSLYVEI